MQRYILSVLLLILGITISLVSHAQFYFTPVGGKLYNQKIINQPLEQDSTETFLTLPFFEDFSDYGLRFSPDTNRWQQQSGVLINNTLAITPPSTGVATFDGSNLNGQPYNQENPNVAGVADVVTSQFFNLAAYDTGQLKMSFYWQAQGKGEQPDAADSLILQFKASSGRWFNAWSVGGGEAPEAFKQETVTIADTLFLHEAFQFRFQNIGKLSGAFDAWHLDYIHFYDSLADDPNLRFDVALSEQPNSFLKNYHDMPLEQFLIAPQEELVDTVFAAIQHLADTFNVISHRFQLLNTGDTAVLSEWQTGSIGQSTSFSGTNIIRNLETIRLAALPQSSAFQNIQGNSVAYEMRFLVNSNERDRLIPTTRNDTLLHKVTLHNYYAYDDGTAEFGIGIQEKFGQLAYQFTLNKPDTLTAVDFSFIQLGASLSGESLRMKIWQVLETGEVENTPQYIQGVVVAYPQERNGFIRFELDKPQVLEGTFFIGFEQLTNQRVTLGYDVNTKGGDKIFFNIGNGWEQNNQFEGSIMMRPVFAVVEGEEEPLSFTGDKYFPNLLVYPNPTKQYITIEGEVESATLYGIDGNEKQSQYFSNIFSTKQLNLQGLPNGLYFLKISRGQYQTIEKVILQN